MSTTTNIIAGVTLTSALVVGGIALSPEDEPIAADATVDAGPAPMVGNFYLRFPDEATFRREVRSTDFWQANVELEDAGPDAGMVPVTVDSGIVIMANMGHAFDILGTLVVPRRDADGGVIPDGGSETLGGFHVNFSGILPEAWKGYRVDPRHPVRKMR